MNDKILNSSPFDKLIAAIGPEPRRHPLSRDAHGVTYYGPWRIYFEPPPIPMRNWDWHWYHEDFDGAPDGRDSRCGSCASFADALNECDEWEDENA